MNSRNYKYNESNTISPNNETFQLHNHDYYEIFLFYEGDSKYIVENKSYSLEPLDMIIIRKNELHRVYHNNPAPYHRFTLFITPAFFQENNCSEYETHFLNSSINVGNKIPAGIVRSSGLYDVILKLRKYSDNYQHKYDSPVIKCLIIEILHLINQTPLLTTSDYLNDSLQPLISYLNKNYTTTITLDMLQDKFFISKYHLCNIFKETTGHTIQGYLRKKRLARVQELVAEGKNLAVASTMSGFNNYASFFRAYKKEYGKSPKKEK